jgi:hypothetical protein
MAYVIPNDFRTATLAEYCQNLSLSTSEAADAALTAAIVRFSARIDDLTDDHFESQSLTFDLSGDGSRSLQLPQRCTAVTTIKTRDYLGNLTAQSATAYRLVSSLNSGGATRRTLDAVDVIEIVPYQYLQGLVGQPWWLWPRGPNAIQVVGTFGWTVTPGDIKRAVALMVYDHFKALNLQLRRAVTLNTADATYGYGTTPGPTGITEADEIIRDYTRPVGLLVG